MIKILLVEDDLGLSNSVFDFLDDFADVMQVFDGEEGLYEAESGVYDLILLDLMLPEKNGFQVLKELREKGITTPVLIMTAKESLDDKGHGFELGADDYLTKPFYLEELKMRIQALLKRSGKFNEKPMTVTEIVESEKELTTPTVHTVLRKLLDKGYVQVIDTVQTGKVFARRYKAKKTQDEEIEEKIEKCMKNSRNPMSFVNTITAALLNGAVDEESVIDELERIVQKRKKEIL